MDLDQFIQNARAGLERDGLFGALQALNATDEFRYTGIYRFDGRWMKNVWLFDRELPRIQFGSDVLWDDSYCRLASADGECCVISDALQDDRLVQHSARGQVRSYAAVVLRTGDGRDFGTLCEYDVVPRTVAPSLLERMRALRPLVEEALSRDLVLEGGLRGSLLRGPV